MPENIQWFESWFDTPYYHLLYAKRDENEAKHFLDRLADMLQIPPRSEILDLACGKGRHSVYLHTKGFQVTGVDLSANSIAWAKKSETFGLRFEVHDMREPLTKKFNYVFSLFTSFGYFEKDDDDQSVLNAIGQMLLPGGIFILDFLNSVKVAHDIEGFVGLEIDLEGINFAIHKRLENGRVIKQIKVTDNGREYLFTEKVRLYDQSELSKMMQLASLQPFVVHGNYQLAEFDPDQSDRLIIFARKK